MNEDGREQLLDVLEEAVSGRIDVTSAAPRARAGRLLPARRPAVRAGDSLRQSGVAAVYTILDIIANNAIGLLHRISRVISRHGCDVDLVLISTEGEKAIDVFHITQAGAKLSDAAQQALTADLQRMLEGTDEAD